MILPTITWGEARAIYEYALEQPYGTDIEDNILADPKMMDESEGKADDEYVFPEEAEKFLDADVEALTAAAPPGAPTAIYFTVDDDGNVMELVKEEVDPDGFYVRVEGEWVDISREDEFPSVYDMTVVYATDDAVAAWDSEFENQQDVRLEHIKNYILQ